MAETTPTPREAATYPCPCDGYVLSIGGPHDPDCPVKRAIDAPARATDPAAGGDLAAPAVAQLPVITGRQAERLEVGSVLLYLDHPASLPIVRRPDGWFSALHLDVCHPDRAALFALLHRAPARTEVQLAAIAAELRT